MTSYTDKSINSITYIWLFSLIKSQKIVITISKVSLMYLWLRFTLFVKYWDFSSSKKNENQVYVLSQTKQRQRSYAPLEVMYLSPGVFVL